MVRGAIQLPPGGEPVLFLADHPVTGGYPVVGVLTASAADRAAQLRPGDAVRLVREPADRGRTGVAAITGSSTRLTPVPLGSGQQTRRSR